MFVERDLSQFVVFSQAPLGDALARINSNKSRIVFCVSAHGLLEGSLSDGDVRRWGISKPQIDLSTAAIDVANRHPITASIATPRADIAKMLRGPLTHIPLVDHRGRLVGIAVTSLGQFRLGALEVTESSPTVMIAELGINHNGSVERARRLVHLAVECGADCVKFQMRDLSSLYRGEEGSRGATEDLGPQYVLDLLSKFSLAPDELMAMFDLCRELGAVPLCTPWDLPSLAALLDYGIPALKIASADLTNHELVGRAAESGTPVILSTGMSTESEISETVKLLRSHGAQYALLQCNSTYPAPFKDVNLRYMDRLAELGECPVGYSGHERGFHVPLAAVARGAKLIEKHFTTDKSLEGNDHTVSLLPEEFAEMVSRAREIEEALGGVEPRSLTPGEMMNRINLAKSLIAAQPIDRGEVITADHIVIRSPGRGLQPNALPALLGRVSSRQIAAGDFFYPSDLDEGRTQARPYRFRRPWGLPVRYHDYEALAAKSNPDFVEFHLSYKDLEIPASEAVPGRHAYGLAVHSPDLFTGDHILNFAADDDDYWKRSIAELQRVIDLTRQLAPRFSGTVTPVVIVSLGGFTATRHVDARERERMYARVADGIARLNTDEVLLCAQTLPPFPWYLGGQLFCNLFVDPVDTAQFCRDQGVALCLDISHTKLACNWLGRPLSIAVDELAPVARHLHLVDASGVDGEGLQIGDGEIDFASLSAQLDDLCPQAGFIPEIWQGHVDEGEGFWLALERLEEWF